MRWNKTTRAFLILLSLMPWLVAAGTTMPLANEPLVVPATTDGTPAPGKRVRITPPEYIGTDVSHSLYLPPDWHKDGRYPVIVEYTGNYAPALGSTGEVKDASLGYGLSAGKFIWVVLPFVSENGKKNERTWWGDESATVAYCKRNVPRICQEYSGDPAKVFLCGFSRGAIAVNYIGLHDDEIARLWCGFITHDHYDGVSEWKYTAWGTPLEDYHAKARERLARLHGRPVLIMQRGTTKNISEYLGDSIKAADFTFLDVPIESMFPVIPNEYFIHPHTDKWPLFGSESTDRARGWLLEHANANARN